MIFILRAVIFDFDGVITDSEILHFRGFNRALAEYGSEITKQDYYKHYLGLTDVDFFTLLVDKGLLQADEDGIKNLLQIKKQAFEELAKTEGRIFEGVRDFLHMLKQNDMSIAIYSGALLSEIELILEEARLRSFFEVIVSAEHIKKGKPNPEGFLLALQKLNRDRCIPTANDQCVAIEDSHWGLEAAKAAGMHTVAVTNSYDASELTMAERIVASLSELTIDDLEQLCV